MKLMRLALIALAALAAGCSTTPEPSGPVYWVMRHLHTPAGERDPDLTAEGQRQAALLPAAIGGERPAAIYVSTFKRTRQSAAPLAARLGLTPIVYDPADTPGLVARVRAGPLPALIVGHSNTVPDIIEQLGGARPAPLVHEDFGDLWRIGPEGTTRRRIAP
jgi:broad specificity phosphatase PhoE